ncbi:hypothetical protein R1sor_014266 [Riccia sorocarpa]|uniref:CRM domain-containing protein n=1 Tax=Riccia sorocarpa TaxID=122646 RepID=A0ABD3HBY0_9MARC
MLRIGPMPGVVFRSSPSRLSFHFSRTVSRKISLSRIAWCSDSSSGDPEQKSSVNPVNPDSNSSRLSETLLSDSSLNPFSSVPPPPSFTGRPGRYVVGRIGPDFGQFRSVGSRSEPSLPSIPGKFSKYSKPIRNLSSNAQAKNQRPNKKPYRRHMANVRSPARPSPHSPYESLPQGYDPDSFPEDEEINSDSDASMTDEIRPKPDSVVRKESGGVTKLPAWMEHYQYSYSEVPKAPILGFRETPYSPFGPADMVARPWTGSAPLKPQKKKPPEFDSFHPPPPGKKGVKYVQRPGPFLPGEGPKPGKTREEILGEPLTDQEIKEVVEASIKSKKMVNLGRDGLTHNMLEVIHNNWKRSVCCKVRCKGVPTLDMDNLVRVIEEKTGGVVISRAGGTIYLFRGRNYNYKDRPKIPLMLWKPPTPVYPKLIVPVPEGLTEEEAKLLRGKARRTEPLCKLSKNGVYLNLVADVRAQFTVDEVVRVDCTGLNPSDYKKIGAKLKDLVPCVLLSFEKEQIMMWRGKRSEETTEVVAEEISEATSASPESSTVTEVNEVDLLFQQAIADGKAVQLNEAMDPDLVFKKAAELSEATKFQDTDVPSVEENSVEPETDEIPLKETDSEPIPVRSPFDTPPAGGLGLDELAKLLRS